MKENKTVKFSISIPKNLLDKVAKKSLKRNQGNKSAYVCSLITDFEQLQDLYEAASNVISCVPLDMNNVYLPHFDKHLEIYKKKRDKYFQK